MKLTLCFQQAVLPFKVFNILVVWIVLFLHKRNIFCGFFKNLCSTGLKSHHINVQLIIWYRNTFSPDNAGTESLKLLKLSLIWSRRFLSRALWCALFSAYYFALNWLYLQWGSLSYLGVVLGVWRRSVWWRLPSVRVISILKHTVLEN